MEKSKIENRKRVLHRYRQRQKAKYNELIVSTSALHIENQSMEQEINLLKDSISTIRYHHDTYRMNEIRQYFSLFRYGYNASETKHIAIIDSLFTPHLLFVEDNITGRENLLLQWKRFKELHQYFRIDLNHVDVHCNGDVIRASFTLCMQISRSTIASIYPKLLADTELVSKLIGKDLILQGKNFLSFESGKVVNYQVELDYLSAWTKLLQDAKQAISIVRQAKLNKHGLIPEEKKKGSVAYLIS